MNQAPTRLFDLALAPLDGLPPMAGLALLSLVTAVAILLAFKWTADQRRSSRPKRAMQAAIFEMRLFNDDLAAMLRAQGEVLRHTCVPAALACADAVADCAHAGAALHMEFRFGYTGLAIGEAALVKVRLAGDGGPTPTAALAGGAEAVGSRDARRAVAVRARDRLAHQAARRRVVSSCAWT